jgi:hypothetical protein
MPRHVGDYLDAIAVENGADIIVAGPMGTAACANGHSVGSFAISCSKGQPARF